LATKSQIQNLINIMWSAVGDISDCIFFYYISWQILYRGIL
jgi:hypothetical protein